MKPSEINALGMTYDPDGPPVDAIIAMARELVELGSGIAGAYGALSPKGRAIIEALADAFEEYDAQRADERDEEIDYDRIEGM